MTQKVEVVRKILDSNDRLAAGNQARLDDMNVFSINLMASPGAGKTSLILQTLSHLPPEIKVGVVEGDTAPVTIDADKIAEQGAPAVQINTGGQCHLDAVLLELGLNQLPLEYLNLVIVENVGNLICPASLSSARMLTCSWRPSPRAMISPTNTPISTAAWMCS